MNCPNCGKDAGDGKFCPECGAKITDLEQDKVVTATSESPETTKSDTETSQVDAYYEALKKIDNEKTKKKKKKRRIGCLSFILIILLFFIILLVSNYFSQRCDTCKGKGTVDCTYCEVSGKIECPECEGSKFADCETCNGTGEINTDERCEACEDSKRPGYKYSSALALKDLYRNIKRDQEDYWNVCSACNGTGYKSKTCPDCKGTGRSTDKSCEECEGTGEVTCTYCNGTLKMTCPDCNGSGKNSDN